MTKVVHTQIARKLVLIHYSQSFIHYILNWESPKSKRLATENSEGNQKKSKI